LDDSGLTLRPAGVGTVGAAAAFYPQPVGARAITVASDGALWFAHGGTTAGVVVRTDTERPVPSGCVMPYLYGLTLAAVRDELSSSTSCALGDVHGPAGGVVVGASPAPATLLPAGGRVNLLLGLGRPVATGTWRGVVTWLQCNGNGDTSVNDEDAAETVVVRRGSSGALTARLGARWFLPRPFRLRHRRGATYVFADARSRRTLTLTIVRLRAAVIVSDPTRRCGRVDNRGLFLRNAQR
jgi:hypothetical protein